MDLVKKYPDEICFLDQQLSIYLEQATENAPDHVGTKRLKAAMRYSLFGKGKRLRPWLVLESARIAANDFFCKWPVTLALPAAMAVEYVHTYSLIHDDLPSMDNDDVRRGIPTNHRRFDEATAILAGDALLADAFAILGQAREQAGEQCATLAKAVGSLGMVRGQMNDVYDVCHRDERRFMEINRDKTGKLFECACVLGALSVRAPKKTVESLREFGLSFGLAFQLIDDFDDDSEIVSVLGRSRVLELAQLEINRSVNALVPFGGRAQRLLELALSFTHHY